MSEKQNRAVGAHPDLIRPVPNLGKDIKGNPISRSPLKSSNTVDVNQGSLDLDNLDQESPIVPEPLVFYGPEKPHLKRWFKKGASLYSLDFPVPRSLLEARNRLAGTLSEAAELDISMEDLVWSEKLGRWRERPKKEHKTKLFGAFVIVDIPSTGANGKQVMTRRFASLNDLQKPEDNIFARFKAATK